MTKGKPIKKVNAPFKTHSKKTGVIILLVLGFLIVGTIIFFYLVIQENEKFEIELDNYLALSCDDMKKQTNGEAWKEEALLNKRIAGEC